MKDAWIVFIKELRDALRDRRTLMAVVLSSVAMGPLLLFGLSVLVASSGRRYARSALASNRPAKPPTPPSTSGPWVRRTADFMSSTARSPAAVSTPASE